MFENILMAICLQLGGFRLGMLFQKWQFNRTRVHTQHGSVPPAPKPAPPPPPPIHEFQGNEEIAHRQRGADIYCLMQHFNVFFDQAAYGNKADFAEPCAKCNRLTNCDLDWLAKIAPFCEQTGIYVNLCYQEIPKTQSNEGSMTYEHGL